ncbi:hypothetical protein EPR50_G00235910 [Perca flavescens]|uniref:Uncharacterized protein n=1 Tax=Perca flavescens TaxID=8167 RepID=A0A484BY33_PERFV|nr:hypothetical protein EPR50_G00235910 [Perca flavescens]
MAFDIGFVCVSANRRLQVDWCLHGPWELEVGRNGASVDVIWEEEEEEPSRYRPAGGTSSLSPRETATSCIPLVAVSLHIPPPQLSPSCPAKVA